MKTRRHFMASTLGVFLAGIGSRLLAADDKQTAAATAPATGKTDANPGHDMSMMPPGWVKPDQIAMLVYPGFTALDLIGPQYMLAGLMGATVHIVSATREPVTSDTKVTVVPTATYDEVPNDLTVLFIPGGGESVITALGDDKLMAFVRDRGSRATYVTSTCTGSLILAGAGLLQGYKATSHWVARDALVAGGATPVNERVVRDRNRITGAGVTAGIDLGLTVMAELRDPFYAQNMQLLAEYAPKPPFDAGTPETAPKEAVELMSAMFTGYSDKAQTAIKKPWVNADGRVQFTGPTLLTMKCAMEFLQANLDYLVLGTLGLMSFVMLALVVERYVYLSRVKVQHFDHIETLKIDLTRNLTTLSSIGSNAPYVGLLGTVLGILVTFYTMGQGGKIEVQSVMLGLALALKATAAGLLVAIPAILFYNGLLRKVDVQVARWQAWKDRCKA